MDSFWFRIQTQISCTVRQPEIRGEISPRIKGSDATLVQSRVCLTAPIFTSARACGHQALARTPSQGTTHHTDDLAGSLGLSCVLGASLEEMLGEDSPLATSLPATPATEVQPEDHRNALDRKVLQKTPVLLHMCQLAFSHCAQCYPRKCFQVVRLHRSNKKGPRPDVTISSTSESFLKLFSTPWCHFLRNHRAAHS